MMKRISIIATAILFISAAFTATAADSVLLQYNPAAGTTTKYQMNLKGNTTVAAYGRSQTTNLETNMLIQQKVTGVDRVGNVTMETLIMDGKILINGQATQLPELGNLTTVKMAKDGEILEQSEGMGDATQQNAQMQIRFPKTPVSVGHTWKSRIEPNPQLPIPMETTYEIVSLTEMVNGEKCAVIKSTVTTDKAAGGSINLDVRADGTIWFAYEKGIMLRNEVRSRMLMLMQNDMGDGNKENIQTRMNLILRMDVVK
ncbi:MAG: hypothetical protein GX221_06790 [Candidatus Riflebacteria bacterium]|nr:hypothetical protein [Candidatus Riflebacteria bacterium]